MARNERQSKHFHEGLVNLGAGLGLGIVASISGSLAVGAEQRNSDVSTLLRANPAYTKAMELRQQESQITEVKWLLTPKRGEFTREALPADARVVLDKTIVQMGDLKEVDDQLRTISGDLPQDNKSEKKFQSEVAKLETILKDLSTMRRALLSTVPEHLLTEQEVLSFARIFLPVVTALSAAGTLGLLAYATVDFRRSKPSHLQTKSK